VPAAQPGCETSSFVHLSVRSSNYSSWPVPVAGRSKAWFCGRSLAGVVGSNPTEVWMSVFCECFVLSGRGLCIGLITSPVLPSVFCVCVCVSHREYHTGGLVPRRWCGISECDRETSILKRSWPTGVCCVMERKNKYSV